MGNRPGHLPRLPPGRRSAYRLSTAPAIANQLRSLLREPPWTPSPDGPTDCAVPKHANCSSSPPPRARPPGSSQPQLVEDALGKQTFALLRQLEATCLAADELAEAVEESFVRHTDAKVILSFPGLGVQLGARVLAEIGDDRQRFTDARGMKSLRRFRPRDPRVRQETPRRALHGQERPAQPRRLPNGMRSGGSPALFPPGADAHSAPTRARRLARGRPAPPVQPHDPPALPLPSSRRTVRRTHRLPLRTGRSSLTTWHREMSQWAGGRPCLLSPDDEDFPKDTDHRPLHSPARRRHGDLRRRDGAGDPTDLSTRARLVTGRAPDQSGTRLQPRAGEDWVSGGLRVRDRQQIAMTASSRNSAFCWQFLQQARHHGRTLLSLRTRNSQVDFQRGQQAS